MKSITIKGSQRESVGKVATKALRNAGKVPCVLYGGDKPVHFSATELAFKNLVYTPNVYTASLDVDGTKYAAILQDIQFHPVTDKIIHVDFYQLFDDKEVTMNIPVQLVGTSPGVLNGGSLRFPKRKLRVKALPGDLPDFFEADISGLKIGSKFLVTDIKSENCTFLHPDNTVVVQVRTSRNAAEDEELEGEEGEGTEAAAEGAEAAAPAAE
ncbi:LSU ribosomal protein L25P [Lutibacter sp. Hel_I_33_5]|uniref:50S ribosomal protein L25/general stress protein Ctc n=1 Tax=Lutibacter sp. Hel_I_33_5 TaxID=1566289 RepID=UPI0011A2CF44|nr:50S ribosomal protein L25/general stress protein Ctc [Lutibacter sp. Hel_I_33_5]TVZ56484.1 LSU ribosomal protein L25P [Lutibacter sp. Hel_I_33_5]